MNVELREVLKKTLFYVRGAPKSNPQATKSNTTGWKWYFLFLTYKLLKDTVVS